MPLNGIKKLTERGVLAEMFARMSGAVGQWWSPLVARVDSTDPESEDHGWLLGVPQMAEQGGKPNLADMRAANFVIRNKDWNAGIRVPLKYWLSNKVGQVSMMLDRTMDVAMAHPGVLLQSLITSGESTVCYDGQYFFDTDHAEGDSGTQDNDLTHAAATGTAWTAAEAKVAILKAVGAIMGFKDDRGNEVNLDAKDFMVAAPTALYPTILEACNALVLGNDTNILAGGKIGRFIPQILPRWTGDKLAVFRMRNANEGSAFIWQVYLDTEPVMLGPDSEHAKLNDEVVIRAKGTYNLGYGRWQDACLVTAT